MARSVGHDLLESRTHVDLNAVPLEFNFQRLRHFAVKQRQDLRLQFDQRGRQAAPHQLFDHLQTNEPGSHHHRMAPGILLQRRIDAIRVLQVAQRIDVRRINALERRHNRLRAGCEDQLGIGLLIGRTINEIMNRHRLGRPINMRHFLSRPDIEAEPAPQELGRRNQ